MSTPTSIDRLKDMRRSTHTYASLLPLYMKTKDKAGGIFNLQADLENVVFLTASRPLIDIWKEILKTKRE